MTRLVLTLSVFLAPLAATSSLAQDVAYWQAAHTWQHTHPLTYYPYTVAILLAAIVVRRIGRQKPGQSRDGPQGKRRRERAGQT